MFKRDGDIKFEALKKIQLLCVKCFILDGIFQVSCGLGIFLPGLVKSQDKQSIPMGGRTVNFRISVGTFFGSTHHHYWL